MHLKKSNLQATLNKDKKAIQIKKGSYHKELNK